MDWLIDQLLPVCDFRSRYARRIAAEPAQVWTALHTVGYGDLPVTRLLMTVRTGGRARLRGPVAQSSLLRVLAQREAREMVVGGVGKFWRPRPVAGPASTRTAAAFAAFTEPGWAKGAMSFQLAPVPGGQTLLAVDTRVLLTSAAARRAFAPYWLLIRAGGAGFIRLEMLRAVARRAGHGGARGSPPQHAHGAAGPL